MAIFYCIGSVRKFMIMTAFTSIVYFDRGRRGKRKREGLLIIWKEISIVSFTTNVGNSNNVFAVTEPGAQLLTLAISAAPVCALAAGTEVGIVSICVLHAGIVSKRLNATWLPRNSSFLMPKSRWWMIPFPQKFALNVTHPLSNTRI